VDHDLTPGASVTYFMTGPDGDRSHGWWRVLEVGAPHRLEIEDGFADRDGRPNSEMPTMTMRVTLVEQGDGTRMTIETSFPSTEAMERLLEMGMDEGMAAALGQVDAILLEPTRSGR
jgi:uncharacterized protein YndB with AHSA1/START domain